MKRSTIPQNDVKDLFTECEILVINESKFNTRAKYPNGFIIIGRSCPSGSSIPRGVIVYRKMSSFIDAQLISNDFIDCVIFRILPMNIICVAPYIPPSNSNYFQKEYFDNLELFLEKFKKDSTLCFGDLNTRFGEPRVIRDDANYNSNPDTVVNSNGRTLKWRSRITSSMVYINYESNFSYFRGGLRSQNDVCITNDINLIASFSFGEKLIYSDHKPVHITNQGNSVANLDIVNRCALYTRSLRHKQKNETYYKTEELEHAGNDS